MNRLVAAVWLLGLVPALAACGPNPKAPVKVMALVPSETGALTQQQVDLLTITNMTNLSGQVAQLVGGVSVVLDVNDPLQGVAGGLQNQTDEQRWAAIIKNEGMPVRGHFIEKGGVLWPEDFHTWNMVTTYYNFERAYTYFQGVYGIDPLELQHMKVLYWADYRPYTTTSVTDNALFLSTVKAFVILPQESYQLVPIAMNIGVIGHEVAHRVFNFKALGDVGVHPALGAWTALPFNLLKSMDEGFADFHGYGVTCLEPSGCRPAFLSTSIADSRTVASRDLSRTNNCLDETTRAAFVNFTPDMWVRAPEMYKIGSLWASALFQAANKAGKVGVMQKALVAAYDDETPRNTMKQEGGPGLRQLINNNLATPQNFNAESVADVLLAHVTDPELKKNLCSELLTRLQLACTNGGSGLCKEIPACPFTAVRDNNTCSRLPALP
jgi:hypothetical protein